MKKLNQSTLSEGVFQNLKEEIVLGNIPQGQKISEVNLATRFNISRGPLREALRQLESINLIERTPHSGSKVISLTYSKIRELYQIREAMEGYATRLASVAMTQSDIDGLYRLLDQHNKQIQSSGDHISRKKGIWTSITIFILSVTINGYSIILITSCTNY